MTKEEKSEYGKKWREANKEERSENSKRDRESYIQPFYVVYCIPNEDPPYCGKTNNPYNRMLWHKYNGKDLGEEGNEWFILDVCMTNKEALDSERAFHRQGYGGGDRRSKGYIFFVPYANSWRAFGYIDGKHVYIKSSKHKDVALKALEQWKKDNL